MRTRYVQWMALAALLPMLARSAVAKDSGDLGTSKAFPPELVHWVPHQGNPVFTAEGPGHWDVKTRERGWILREGDEYHLWFTGYDGTREGIRQLGYATSTDGVHWTRPSEGPFSPGRWIEDMMVVKHGDRYLMFAEGSERNHAEMLTSTDLAHWTWEGPLDVRRADGTRPVEKPCGTPTVIYDNDKWYLFYERGDRGVWLATSDDPMTRIWTNVQDDPVLAPGPTQHDAYQIALNQVIKYHGSYYGFYHGCGDATNRIWSIGVARSGDLIHWEKYAGNPLVDGNRSSGIVVPVNGQLWLYAMHGQVDIFEPAVGNDAAGIKPERKSAAGTSGKPPAIPAVRR